MTGWQNWALNHVRLVAAILLFVSAPLAANDFHPALRLLDQAGEPVIESGEALSLMNTCGACHDSHFITSSSDHVNAGVTLMNHVPGAHISPADTTFSEQELDAILRKSGGRHVGGGAFSDLVEMDCLLCHSDLADNRERTRAIEAGEFDWANSVRLLERQILLGSEGNRVWNPERFLPDGTLVEGLISISKPTDNNCAQCHGLASTDLDPPLTLFDDGANWSMTERTGQIISPQKIVLSGMNIAGKEGLNHAFDVHADRVIGCVNCHYSLNNPVYFEQREESLPAHLEFDPRRLSSAEYLQRPLHQFAKGKSTLGLASAESENSLRRCESCHDAGSVHQWLPYRERHFSALACESCHIPKLYGPALQSVNWALVDAGGDPLRVYRGVTGAPSSVDNLLSGFRPVLLARENRNGDVQLAPFNLVSSWYWTTGDPVRPVGREQLVAALYPEGYPHPDLLRALDENRDGALSDIERELATPEQAEVVRRILLASGLEQVHLASALTPWSISHNVVNGRWATRDCANCHDEDSILAAPFMLADGVPGGAIPVLEESAIRYSGIGLDGSLLSGEDGTLNYVPEPSVSGFYIIGLHGVDLIDQLGLLMFFGIALGVTGHALARYYFNRRRRLSATASNASKQRVYMYDRYERLWHWLQASVILILLATGLIIHKPHIFGMFSFSYMVQVHNVLGFILLINAALALFYNLASGEMRQYLPEPRGFVGRSIAQAMYYSRGIFAGEAHPLEKTRERKLNPLQQVTYLAILNILLPAQVITGVLIWGLQKWPEIAGSLGGLPLLAPVHTLVAWAFASFIVMHVYLTTAAGDTPSAGIKSMISGWEEVEQHHTADPEANKES